MRKLAMFASAIVIAVGIAWVAGYRGGSIIQSAFDANNEFSDALKSGDNERLAKLATPEFAAALLESLKSKELLRAPAVMMRATEIKGSDATFDLTAKRQKGDELPFRLTLRSGSTLGGWRVTGIAFDAKN